VGGFSFRPGSFTLSQDGFAKEGNTLDGTHKRSRRSVLTAGVKAAAAFGLTNLAGPLASAASPLNRTCVGLYLFGGNDSNNLIVPLDSPAYELYAKGRGALAIPRNDLLSVYDPATSSNYGFHPNLPGLRDLYKLGALGIVANVGAAGSAGQLPQHSPDPMVRYMPAGRLALPWGDSFVLPLETSVPGRREITASAPLSTRFPATRVGQLLESVAKELKTGTARGQAFLVPISGFDTHGNQLARQAELFAELDGAVAAFQEAVTEIGIANQVTLFTQTEFNRAFGPNGTGGTEHGWGGHQLVVGRSVLGGRIYGRFPSLALGGPNDAGSTGIWLPSISNVQYEATLATWFGLNVGNLAEFESLRNSPQTDLGFMLR
jgi:uncharacterized protein (DUF1501 family)